MGLLPRMAGVLVDGRDLLALPVEERVRIGISYVPQVRNVFGALTVLENLRVVEHVRGREQRIRDMFDLFPALAGRRGTRAENLSGGERQQLARARADVLAAPDGAGRAFRCPVAALTEQVFAEVRRLPQIGVGVLMVEQRAPGAGLQRPGLHPGLGPHRADRYRTGAAGQ